MGHKSYRHLPLSIFMTAAMAMPAAAEGVNPTTKLRGWADKLTEASGNRLFLSGYMNAHYMDHDGVARLIGKDINRPIKQIREISLFVDYIANDVLSFSGEVEFSADFSGEGVTNKKNDMEPHLNYLYADIDISELLGHDVDETGRFNCVRANFWFRSFHITRTRPVLNKH